jgi:hypothetical protein
MLEVLYWALLGISAVGVCLWLWAEATWRLLQRSAETGRLCMSERRLTAFRALAPFVWIGAGLMAGWALAAMIRSLSNDPSAPFIVVSLTLYPYIGYAYGKAALKWRQIWRESTDDFWKQKRSKFKLGSKAAPVPVDE